MDPAYGSQSPSTPKNINFNKTTTTKMATRKMPQPGEKNAPFFDVERPQELNRFFERMEDWFAEENLTGEVERKKKTVRYTDVETEDQWKALSRFEVGTFDQFKEQVIACYPRAVDVAKGSVAGLKKKIKQIGLVSADDRDELLTLIRIMTAEVAKLKKISPPIHTNRELVDIFLGRLTQDFAANIAAKLSVHRLAAPTAAAAAGAAATAPRNPEDMYDVADVMEMANLTAQEHSNPFAKYLGRSGSSEGEGVAVKVEEAISKMNDTMSLYEQHTKLMEQRLSTLQNLVSQRPQGPSIYSNPNQGAVAFRSNGAPQAYGGTYNREKEQCFYCGEPGHRIPDCVHVLRHLDLGWIKRVDNHLRFANGARIPRDPTKQMKDLVEEANKPPKGILYASKTPGLASFLQDRAGAVEGLAKVQHVVDDESEALNLVAEITRKFGPDAVHKAMTTTLLSDVVPEEDYNQNFD